jgi:sialidase-1
VFPLSGSDDGWIPEKTKLSLQRFTFSPATITFRFMITLRALLASFGIFTSSLIAHAQGPQKTPANLVSAEAPKIAIEHHLTLSPNPGNPRNSEGDFIQRKDGHWLFVYTHFTTGADDHAKAHLASRESSDGGKTWTTEDKVVIPNEGGFNIMSVSLLRLQSGAIALFYLRKNSLQDCRPVMRVSKDEGQTWSDPTECIPEPIGYYVLNNSRVIQLPSGRLILPTALHGFEKGRLLPGKIVIHMSDDEGKTWRRSDSVLENDAAGTRINFMEPGVVALDAKRILMLIRTKLGRQYLSESSDAGATWSIPAQSPLFSPESPATVKKIPSTGDLLVVWNDHSREPDAHRRSPQPIRTPYAAAISNDGGKTWLPSKLLENQPHHGYCYTAIAFDGDRVLLGYCAHPSRYGLETAQISSFQLEDLYR